jgi:Cu/Ag efflux pump CusA
VVDAVMRGNRSVGGNVVEASSTWSVVRGLGLIERVSDLEQVVIGPEHGVPIFLHRVAEVKVGDAFRANALVRGTEEAVGGVARCGVSTVEVIKWVKEKLTVVQAIGARHVVFVPVAGGEGRFFQRTVQLGRVLGESYSVLKGLEPGEVIVAEGSFFLRAESLRNAPSS